MWEFSKYKIGEGVDWADVAHSYAWVNDMKHVPQDAIWHAEGNVYIHTQMVVEALQALPTFEALSKQAKHILICAALLHDVEKRSTTREELIDGKVRIVAPRHAKKGEFTARKILYTKLNVPFQVREQICKLVRWHGLPVWAITKDDPDKSAIYASTVVNTHWLTMLATADMQGRVSKSQDDLLLNIELFRELCLHNNCYGSTKHFKSNYGRYLYLNKADTYVDYLPYEDSTCVVTMLCGLPGSGKDTYIHKNIQQPVLSLDDIRRAHKISPTDKKKNGRVIQIAKEEAKRFLRTKTSFVFNATNITKDIRARWIGLFGAYKAKVKLVYIEVPYAQLLQQNANREHKVPVSVIDKLIGKMEIPDVKEAQEVEYVINGNVCDLIISS